MQKDNTVIFKGGKNGIVILLDEKANFQQITKSLRTKIRDASKFFSNAATTISFKGKELSETELLSLIEIISTETSLSITFVEDLTGTFEIKKNNNYTEGTERHAHDEDSATVRTDTYYHNGGLRSGQDVNYNGSVVVLGDVNAGAEVVAAGNVVVFGAVRGMVHAGASGDTGAFVVALSMQPVQLRIADKITYFPKEIMMENKSKIDPMYAFIRDGQVCVAPMAN